MSTITRESIINSALELIGHGGLSSFDNSPIGIAATNRYETLARFHLSDHPWRFAIREAALSQLTGTGSEYLSEWQYAYTLPTGYIRAIGVTGTVFWEIAGSELYTDLASGVVLRYIKDVPASEYSPQFVEALTHSLAVGYSLSIADNSARAGELEGLARKAWQRARLHDSQMGPTISMRGAIKRAVASPTFPRR